MPSRKSRRARHVLVAVSLGSVARRWASEWCVCGLDWLHARSAVLPSIALPAAVQERTRPSSFAGASFGGLQDVPKLRVSRRADADTNAVPNRYYISKWRNKVPKAERQESLELHLQHLLFKVARTSEMRRLPQSNFLQALERQVEHANPDKTEEQISKLCHNRLRKLGNALNIGWELELLGLSVQKSQEVFSELERASRDGDDNYTHSAAATALNSLDLEDINGSAVLERLTTLGEAKQNNYMHIKRGCRRGPGTLQSDEIGSNVTDDLMEQNETTVESYRVAVHAQRTTLWHQLSLAAASGVFHQAGAERVLDIGSSFNPLRDKFPSVTAVDVVPTHESVLQANFLEMEFFDPAEANSDPIVEEGSVLPNGTILPRRCVALPRGVYDGALISFVLRAVHGPPQRRQLVRKAAEALKMNGLLVIIERGPICEPFRYRGNSDSRFAHLGVRWLRAQTFARGVRVNVFRRVRFRKPPPRPSLQRQPETPEAAEDP